MNATDKKLLARGINPLTGQPLTPTLAPASAPRIAPQAPQAPAATVAPTWLAEANRAHIAAPEVMPDRPWVLSHSGVSASGRDTLVFRAPMRNGGTFEATLPGDLVRALRAGTVVGMK